MGRGCQHRSPWKWSRSKPTQSRRNEGTGTAMPFPFSFGRYENRRRPPPLPGSDGYSFALTWQHRGEIVAAWHCLIGVPPCGAFRFCFLLAFLLPVARHPPLPAARLPPRRMKTKPWHRPKARETARLCPSPLLSRSAARLPTIQPEPPPEAQKTVG